MGGNKKTMTDDFFYKEDCEIVQIDRTSKRQVLAHDRNLMIVKWSFEAGSMSPVHTHPHTQIAYILNGKFEFIVKESTRIVKTGDSILLEPNVPHGLNCLENGEILDVFTPERKDFLND